MALGTILPALWIARRNLRLARPSIFCLRMLTRPASGGVDHSMRSTFPSPTPHFSSRDDQTVVRLVGQPTSYPSCHNRHRGVQRQRLPQTPLLLLPCRGFPSLGKSWRNPSTQFTKNGPHSKLDPRVERVDRDIK